MKDFAIMVLEDDLVTSITVCKALRLGIPDALVLEARTVAEARLLLKEYTPEFFVLDIHLPDGSGIDFIFDVMGKRPDATVVLITGTPLPEYKLQAEAFGVMNFLAKPVDHGRLLELVRQSRRKSVADAQGDTTLFKASMSRLSVLDIIQLKCLNQATQAMRFDSSKHGSGWVYFQNGSIVHAQTGRSKGLQALSEIIGWKGGRAEEKIEPWTGEQTIRDSWQNALLMAAQTADEAPAVAPPEPAQTDKTPSASASPNPSDRSISRIARRHLRSLLKREKPHPPGKG